MCNIDLEPCEVWSETWRNAAKPHKCDCCHGPIVMGSRYVKFFMLFDGDPRSEKMCELCAKAMGEFAAHDGHMKTMPSGFDDLLIECIHDGDGVTIDENDNEVFDKETVRWKAMRDDIKARQPSFVTQLDPATS
jgi:hypothetical protein